MLLGDALEQLTQKLDAGGASKEDRSTMWLNAAIVVARSILTVRAVTLIQTIQHDAAEPLSSKTFFSHC